MTAMDKNAKENIPQNAKIDEIFNELGAVEIEVECNWEPLARRTRQFMNEKTDDPKAYPQQFRTRLAVVESYRALTQKEFPVLAGGLSVLWALGTGALLDILAGPKAEEAIDQFVDSKTLSPAEADALKALLKVLYHWLPSFLAETGDGTINYTALESMDPESDLHADPSLFWSKLRDNLGDGIKAGGVSALLTTFGTILASYHGGFKLPGNKLAALGVGLGNAILNLATSQLQWVGGALPIQLGPHHHKMELAEAIGDNSQSAGAIFDPNIDPEEWAHLAVTHSASDGASAAGALSSALIVATLALLGAPRVFREDPIIPQSVAGGLQVGAANPAEAISLAAAVAGAKISMQLPPAVAWTLRKLGIPEFSMLDDIDKCDVLAILVAADRPIGQTEFNTIDPKYLAWITLGIGRGVANVAAAGEWVVYGFGEAIGTVAGPPARAIRDAAAPHLQALAEGPVGQAARDTADAVTESAKQGAAATLEAGKATYRAVEPGLTIAAKAAGNIVIPPVTATAKVVAKVASDAGAVVIPPVTATIQAVAATADAAAGHVAAEVLWALEVTNFIWPDKSRPTNGSEFFLRAWPVGPPETAPTAGSPPSETTPLLARESDPDNAEPALPGEVLHLMQ